MLTPEEKALLDNLLAKQNQGSQPTISVTPRTVTICGQSTQFVPVGGIQSVMLLGSLVQDLPTGEITVGNEKGLDPRWADKIIALLRVCFPDLEKQYGIQNLTLDAIQQCLSYACGAESFEALKGS